MPADPWRYRARRVVRARLRPSADSRPHYVVCGQDPLAYYLVHELLAASARVTVIVPPHPRADGPEIRAVRGIRVISADRLDETTFRAVGLVGARGLALMHQDDVLNIHAALCAQAVAPNIRLIIRMFNPNLGEKIKLLFADCRVLSDASMAAPAFVASALGEVAPTHFSYGDRTFYVAHRAHVRPAHVVCGLADTREPNHPRVLPDDEASADLVLAEAVGTPARMAVEARTRVAVRRLALRRRRRRAFALLRAVRAFVSRKTGIAALLMLLVVLLSGTLLASAEDLDGWQAIYVTLLTAATGGEVELEQSPAAQALQLLLTVAGLALVPLITAVVVESIVNARLAINAGRLGGTREGHVIVIGLGNVGTLVISQLHALGVKVVAIDKNPDAPGVKVARQLGIPLIIGDGAQEQTLRDASVATCQALVVVSTDDVTNLQAALNGRMITRDLRVVLRLFDSDFAERIEQAFDIATTHSVSYLAAPAFAAALMDRVVITTIPVDRRVLLVAEVTVAAGSALEGQRLGVIGIAQGVRVIAVLRDGQLRPTWRPDPDTRLGARDRVTVVARRAGLSWLLKQASPPPPEEEPSPETSEAEPPLDAVAPERAASEIGPAETPNGPQ
ncbi:MAG: potassium transporter TrkA [Actinobacteria bacterium]|nr:MAG: potassium transporter TrkA [Actinomycetota bacterium]